MNRILFFAGLKEQIGEGEWSFDAAGLTVEDLKETVRQEFGVEQVMTSMTAVNEEFAQKETIVKEGDTVAFIPPVSGG
ncbi:molybdopterin converting factor subunit 1 [Halobacillus sp. ACCC02827]|uniref:molybdopterin converting factor subunit 1 n=1 Tax=unclassified Halobacillus TaxID=2636472 RepID=UPI0002A51110|nr:MULTISPECIES: molybdopterin converting factor subunit 1 [unclassified Halobacillus]ELK45221.1 molybdopterin synthase sulfur carrier subunit MoaD [Halobacillus sp. BAB-2008]WJE16840.1 molybdopterin converting factor subunit 1 [Halobacillus sp. ACCC02827]